MKDTTKITLISSATGAVVMTQVETPNPQPLAAQLAFGGMIGGLAPAGLMMAAAAVALVTSGVYDTFKKMSRHGDYLAAKEKEIL